MSRRSSSFFTCKSLFPNAGNKSEGSKVRTTLDGRSIGFARLPKCQGHYWHEGFLAANNIYKSEDKLKHLPSKNIPQDSLRQSRREACV